MIKNLKTAIFSLIIALGIAMPITGYAAAARPTSGLQGVVTCTTVPSAGATVKVENAAGTFTTTARTDRQGHYSVALAPGDYFAAVVSMKNCTFYQLYRAVTVYPDTYSTMDFNFQ
jgi:hypothetical protein